MNNDLMHYGIPTKSGRYPWGSGKNPYHHGTYKGKLRNVKDMSDDELKEFNKRKALEAQYKKYNKDSLEKTKNVLEETSKATRTASERIRRNKKKKKKEAPDIDLSNMTDQELRDAVNRANLEMQYKRLFSDSSYDDGESRVADILDAAGDSVTIANGALTMAILIREIMNARR